MANPVRIDSRKFLSAINDSAQSKVALFEDRVKQLGQKVGQNWKLAALNARNLYIEDADTHKYYIADHTKENHGKVTISNVRELQIVEGEKGELFTESCLKLVNALEENNQRGMQVAFDRMKAQRFTSKVIPSTGSVKCRDGVLRQVNIANESKTFSEDDRSRLISILVEGLQNNVIVENGSIVAASFNDGEPVKLPVTRWASRKLVAKRMLESAQNAYWSKGFQDRIYAVAKLVSESKIDEAVKSIVPFLDEMEEFTLLNRKQMQNLVENTLAARGLFTQQLCDNTATLLFRTNMKISRGKIIDEWRSIARKSENAVLAENVNILENAKNFESSYQKFLSLIFEAVSNREITAEALATALDNLKNKTPKIKESHDLSSKLNNLISRLKDRNLDDAAIFEAEDLIATIQEELAASDSLQSFDEMPGSAGGDSLGLGGEGGMDLGDGASGSGAPVININSPLIQIGGSSGGPGEADTGGLDDLDLDLGDEEEPAGGDEELDDLLGGAPAAPAAPAPAAPAPAPAPAAPAPAAPAAPAFESRFRGSSLNESRPVHYEMKKKCDDDMPCDDDEDEVTEESYDPYAIRPGEAVDTRKSVYLGDYGAPTIKDSADVGKAVRVMQRLAVENKLTGSALHQNLQSMAQASINALGLRIPEERMPMAIEQVVNTFLEEAGSSPFPGAAPPFGKKGKKSESSDKEHFFFDGDDDSDSPDSDDQDDDDSVAEDQFHVPSIPKRGYKKSSMQKVDESIKWKKRQSDAVLGEMAGVNFVFDHGGDSELPPVILSEDGSVELPIPEDLFDSAFAAAGMARGNGQPFKAWLAESIEQLRPITDLEDSALNEAMARITSNADGSISVEVSDDVEVSDIDELDDMDDDMDGMDDEMDDEMGDELGDMDVEVDMDGDGDQEIDTDVDEMKPVEAVDVSDTEASSSDEDDSEMPDFDSEEESMDDEDEGLAEDNDITDPKNSKYTKHTKENLRDMPTPKLPKKSDDQLEDLGPDLKSDDGSGTKPPVARKGGR